MRKKIAFTLLLWVASTWVAFAQNTIELASYIQRQTTAEPLAHLTCGALDPNAVDKVTAAMVDQGIENVMALRGDKPADIPSDYLKCFLRRESRSNSL